MKIARLVLAVVCAYVLSAASSLLWFLTLTHHDPSLPQSAGYMAATAVYGIVCSLLAGWLAKKMAGAPGRSASLWLGLLIVAVGSWSYAETPGHAHWSHCVAIVLMAPAAWLGGATFGRDALPYPRTQL